MRQSTLELARRSFLNECAARASDAARLANELQRAYPMAERSECLREAERLQHKCGMGLVLGEICTGRSQ